MLYRLLFLVSLSAAQTGVYQSYLKVSDYSLEFDPVDDVELISTLSEYSWLRCLQACNQEPQCRTCDYDLDSCRCRLFESILSTGQLISAMPTSQVASIIYSPELFVSYNKTCDYCEMNRYLSCINGSCACPRNTYWDGEMCLNQKHAGAFCKDDFECRTTELPLTCVQADVCSSTGYPSNICALNVSTVAFDHLNAPVENYTRYSFDFVALSTSLSITFSPTNHRGYLSLDDVSVTNQRNTELLVNGGFEESLTGWNFCNPMSASYAGLIGQLGMLSPFDGLLFWFDGAWPNPDYLSQTISTEIGSNYTLSFWLANNGIGGTMTVTFFQ